MNRKLISVVMLISLFVASVFSINADSINDLQNEIDALEEQNEQAAAKEAEARQQLDDYEELLLQIQEDIASINDQIISKEQEIADLNSEMDTTKAKIAELEEEIPVKKGEADKALVAIQQISESNLVSSLVSGEGGEYLKNASSMIILYNSLAKPLKELKDIQAELQKKKEDLEVNLKTQELAQQELKASEIELESQEDDYNYYIQQQNQIISNSEAEINDTSSEIEDKQNAIDFYESQGCGPDDEYGVDCGDTGVAPGTQGFIRPIESDYVSCEYLCYSGHSGIDLGGHGDREIYPAYPGQVLSAGWSNSGYGNNIVLIHNTPDGIIFTRYAHLSQIYVSAGDTVGYNDQIGYMGNTGNSTATHLHFEVIVDYNGDGYPSSGECVNPRNYVNFPSGTYVWWYDRTSAV